MLHDHPLVAFVPTADLGRARDFYGEVLGLRLIEDTGMAAAFDAHGTTLRVTAVGDFTPLPFTVLGWSVNDIRSTIRGLADRGVAFERYPGMDQDGHGVWTSPSGSLVAWFKDLDGNTLSLTQG